MDAIVSYRWVNNSTDNAVIVATGEDFKDALAAAGFAGLYDCPVLITAKNELTPETYGLLVALEPSDVYVAGGKAAVSDYVLEQIENATGCIPQRVWGKNSASTSAGIALENSNLWEDTAIIATNKSFKDALSAAPISYAKHYPILLAENGKNLNDDVLKALKTCKIKNVVIVGGEKAVTSNVVKQLTKNGINRGNIRRISGDTAVKTSEAIAKWGIEELGLSPSCMGIATSKNYPDALCGAALAGTYGSVLLLADDTNMYNTTFPYQYRFRMSVGYVFGGETAVGMKTWNALIENTAWY